MAVELTDVTKTYRSATADVVALDDISITFRTGSFTAVMGPSGSGKSTLLLCAAGLEDPDRGVVTVEGHDMARMTDARRARLRRETLGFVFQAYNLVPTLPVWVNVGLPDLLGGRRVSHERVAARLAAVGLAGLAGRAPGELSGGQQQRVAIARALYTAPRVLFADEPTAALDTNGRDEILRILRSLVTDQASTIVMVTHDPVVAAHADEVVFLRDGRISGRSASRSGVELSHRLAALESSA